VTWTDPEVQRWFEEHNEMFEISIEQVSDLMTLSVDDLNMLEKKEWKEISPQYGQILFNFWWKDRGTFADKAKPGSAWTLILTNFAYIPLFL
jgi:hypothetical protein